MADWFGMARSSYFAVKDAEAFKEWLAQFEAKLIEKQTEDGMLFGFYSEDEFGGLPSRYPDDDDDVDAISLIEELAPHLAEGHVAIVMEAGSEKARYVTGTAWAIAWHGAIERLSIDEIADRARKAFGDRPDFGLRILTPSTDGLRCGAVSDAISIAYHRRKTMRVVFDVLPARKTPHGYQVVFHLGSKPDALPKKELEVQSLPDLLAQFESYKAGAEATGKPLKVGFRQHPRCPARKFPGFKKAENLDHFTTAAETATEEEMEAV